MKQRTIHTKKYPIIIGRDILSTVSNIFDLSQYSNIVVVCDDTTKLLFLPILTAAIPKILEIVLPEGEKNKNLQTVERILGSMQSFGCDRHSLVVNLGGGVVCDVGGFAASMYMRGVDVLNIPTTLLSQVDAAVGGKTGVNLGGIKNSVGTFHAPIGVLIDTQTLTSLPTREVRSGFAEIMKHGLIADARFFNKATAKTPEEFTSDEMIEIIATSCAIKAAIVGTDEMESSTRKLLNFGHTIGHALEAISFETKKSLTHGEAVVIGMIVESRISQKLGLLTQKDCDRICRILLPFAKNRFNIDMTLLMEKIQLDKKSIAGKVEWTLLKEVGQGIINQHVDLQIFKEALI